MALVMLPSDLPWWSTVEKKLIAIQKSKNLKDIFEQMQSINDLCNVSLDPDDDKRDSKTFDGLKNFIKNDLTLNERKEFESTTIQIIAKHACNLKNLRPPRGLNFSLQQQADCTELNRKFVASLLANAFFSTYPKRTLKTHPTLQDFNFSEFFGFLDNPSQKAKLRCLLKYFMWLELEKDLNQMDSIKFWRKVMTSKQWMTIDDWIDSKTQLCPLEIKHQGQIENSFDDTVQTTFTSARVGGFVLKGGNSQECITLFMSPEALVILLFFEAIEDNEAIYIEGIYQIGKLIEPKGRALLQFVSSPRKVSLCCLDPENFTTMKIHQFEEDNILRELNKCLLCFLQHIICGPVEKLRQLKAKDINVRLSPIGESGSNSVEELRIIVQQPSTSSTHSNTVNQQSDENDNADQCSWLSPDITGGKKKYLSNFHSGLTASGRRGRFIFLGSSGECLPVKRPQLIRYNSNSTYSSCESDLDIFYSAKCSFEDDEEEKNISILPKEINSNESCKTFARRLENALKQFSNYTESTASSYAVGISISGSQNIDEAVRLRRGGSTGFVLAEDSLDEDFYIDFAKLDKEKHEKFCSKQDLFLKYEPNDSSNYSFSTECTSELEEVYDQLIKWLDDPNYKRNTKNLDPRDEAVLSYASSLLKRTLSETFVGVPLTEGCISSTGTAIEDNSINDCNQKTNKLATSLRSLSLELTKYKHKLATQSLYKSKQKCSGGNSSLRQVATGNCGCGHTKMANVQLKFVIQWMAASQAQLPALIYYTSGHEKLSKLDTVARVIRDRKWTIGDMARITLSYAKNIIETEDYTEVEYNFFEKLIGL